MIYLIYTTLLVSGLALVGIFKIIAYIAKEGHSWAFYRRISYEMKTEFIYPDDFKDISITFSYTSNRDLLHQLGIPIGSLEFIPDEEVRKAIIRRKVVQMGSYMLENGYIKIRERDGLKMGYPPDIKYIELRAKVLKPKN